MANKERVQLLVDALRSGKYRQAKGVLRDSKSRFCCLGVACDVYRKNTSGMKWNRENNVWRYGDDSDVLPQSVREWFGFDSNNPDLLGPYDSEDGDVPQVKPAAEWNDSTDLGLVKIADLFEDSYITHDTPWKAYDKKRKG